MRVLLLKKRKIRNIILPDKIEGNYWVTDTDINGMEKNLISIEAKSNEWVLMSNKEIQFMSEKIYYPSVALKEYQFYNLVNFADKTRYLLYCSPFEEKYDYYDITVPLQSGFTIGNEGLITYAIINTVAAQVKLEDNKVYIYDNQFSYGIYINDVRVREKQEIKLGDVVFIMGLKMILTKSENTFYLAVNNPNNKVSVKLMPIGDLTKNNPYQEDKEEFDMPLYTDNDYFHKMPRFISIIKPLQISIDAPPSKEEDPNTSALLTIGPMITMSMTSLVTGYTAINSVLSGQTTWKSATPSLIMCGAMFASMFFWPMLSKRFEAVRRKEQERKRQKKYKQYIEEKREKIEESINEQRGILNNNYPSTKECEQVILNKYTSLWQKRIEDEDFLQISLGYGDAPMEIDIKYPEDHFSMAEDNLKEMVSNLGNEPKILSNVPIVYSLWKNYITSIVGENSIAAEYIRRLLIQLVAFHSYNDLKIIIFTDDDSSYEWEFLKSMPHLFSNDKKVRFFATNNDEYKEICYDLDRLFKSRQEINGTITKENFSEHYLIITDCFKKIRGFDVIDSILKGKNYLGFNLLIADERLTNLPDQCRSFIQLNSEYGQLHNSLSNNGILKFKSDLTSFIDYDACSKMLANVPIKINIDDEYQLPSKVGFLEMYDVGKVEQLNSLSRWSQNNPIANLQAPVGIGKNGEKISIDLHEKYHGPHGLIAGMTGSGKSEFIISYILSMAINYHPYEVQFILIDYKGGGLAGAFENKSIGLKLPHLVGTITNLDANEIKRSLASIESELKRRQALFNKAREISEESTIDIYKYQKMYRQGLIEEPVSHLFIISDEFAELKNQQPEFMQQLISTARIGRSLGVHLILATQKPSGVVDPQIWSNTRFRVCLRVQDKSDSTEVIKCPDAALLKQTGRFYFQVGYNEVFVLGQAAWAGGKYYPAEKLNKTLDTSLEIIDTIGNPIKVVETREKVEKVASNGEELLNIVKYLSSLAKCQKIACTPLWLEKIPEFIYVDDLVLKYNYQKDNFKINPIIGEYDIPSRQQQNLLTLNFSTDGNALVYGSSGSGKENFIMTLLYSSMKFYSPEEVNYYVLDFGTEALKCFSKSTMIGDILTTDDEEKIGNLYKMLFTMIEERKQLFVDYNGDFNTYCTNSGKTVPNVVIIINNYESYEEMYPNFEDNLSVLTRECNRYGIYFMVTVNTPNGVRFKLRQNFAQNFCLQQNNDDDYTTILGNVHKTYPSKLFGRGIIKLEDVYEFQTAYAGPKDELSQYIKDFCIEYSQKYSSKARPIPVLPNVVKYQELVNNYGTTNELIIGLEKQDLEVVRYDFEKNFVTSIMSTDLSNSYSFIDNLIKQMIVRDDDSILVIQADEFTLDQNYTHMYQYVTQKFDDIFDSLIQFITEQQKIYEENNFDKSIFEGKRKINCVIIGLEAFKNKLSSENKMKLPDLFNKSKDLGIISFILVDSVHQFKNFDIESWYKNCVNNSNAIWIGNGINDQYTIKVSQRTDEMREEIPDGFCFVVNRGKPSLVKYIEQVEVPYEDSIIDEE